MAVAPVAALPTLEPADLPRTPELAVARWTLEPADLPRMRELAVARRTLEPAELALAVLVPVVPVAA